MKIVASSLASLLSLFASNGTAHAQAGRAPVAVHARQVEAEAPTVPVTFEGHVQRADGSSAEGALVVTSAGGRAVAGPGGGFRIELALPLDAREVQVSAVHTTSAGTTTASTRVSTARSGGVHGIGTLALSSGGCQPEWLPTFGAFTDLGNVPYALLTFDDGNGPALYVSSGSGVLRLEGTSWTPLGSAGNFNNTVWCLEVFDDGQGNGPALYAGGDFTRVDGNLARGVARWDGTSWSGLGSVLPGPSLGVFTMEVFDDGQGGGPALYVGGEFEVDVLGAPVRLVGRWNGTGWSGTGSNLTGNSVVDLAVFDDGLGAGPRLFAVEGYLSSGEPRNRIQFWDGVSWTLLTDAVTSGPSGFISSVEAFDDGQGGGPALYFGGSFSAIAGTPASNIARWDGTAWSSLGSPGLEVWELEVVTDPLGTALFAGGTGGRVRRWSGTSWSILPLMLTDADVTGLAGFDDGSGPALFVASAFGNYNDADCHITRWDGVRWSTLGTWLNARVHALAVFDDGLGDGPALYAGGLFSIAGDEPARGIAKWDGASWSRLGTGVFGTPRVSVQALTVHDDGSGPALYVGGEFTSAGGGARNVARWNGLGWSPLGPGLNNNVYTLTSFDDGLGAGPMLIAGGLFTASGAVPAQRVARWNGASWSALGSGMDNSVFALAVHDDGAGPGPALFAGGRFTTADGVSANRIARWDGASWAPPGSGLGNDVEALAAFDDGLGGGAALYAGGTFTTAGGAPANRIARWDGASWSPLGSGMIGSVRALAVFDDGTGPGLYATGSFLSANGVAAAHVVRWDGTSFSPLGSGLGTNASGEALAVYTNGANAPALVVAGGFLDAGGSGDSWIALWQGCVGVPPEITCPAAVSVSTPDASGAQVEFVVTAKGPGDPAPSVVCVPPSGSFFPLGTTLVTCTATDAAGLQSSCEFSVSVYRKTRRR